MAEKVEIKQDEKGHEEYLFILDAFRRMVYNFDNSAQRLEVFDDIKIGRAHV